MVEIKKVIHTKFILIQTIQEVSMSKWIVGVIMLVVIAMFYKGIEVLGPSNTNRDVLYEGPIKSTEDRWKAAFEWMEKRKN